MDWSLALIQYLQLWVELGNRLQAIAVKLCWTQLTLVELTWISAISLQGMEQGSPLLQPLVNLRPVCLNIFQSLFVLLNSHAQSILANILKSFLLVHLAIDPDNRLIVFGLIRVNVRWLKRVRMHQDVVALNQVVQHRLINR